MNLISKILKRVKRIKPSLFLLTLFVLATVFAGVTYAQNKITPTLGDIQKGYSTSTGTNKQSFDMQSLLGTLGGLLTLLMGCVDENTANCNPAFSQGATDTVAMTMGNIYTIPPASGVQYMAELQENLNLVPEAYAQAPGGTGVGFQFLNPFLEMWRAVRNMAYVLFVLVIVAIGFMVMFRRRISPQAVMTIQAALPRIIIALIFVTFSYAIAGFVIDLMYVVFGIIVWGMGASGNLVTYTITGQQPYNAQTYFNNFVGGSFSDTFGFIMGAGFTGLWDIFRGGVLSNTGPAIFTGLIAVIAAAAAWIFPAVAAALAAPLIPIALGLLIVILAFLMRTLIALARAYLMLLIYVILGPLFILWGALTGRGIWDVWLKNIVVNVCVFLTVGIVIFLVNVIINQIDHWAGFSPGQLQRGIWGPPYLGSNQVVLLKGMVAIAAVVMLPQIPDIVNQFFGIRGLNIQTPGGRLLDDYSRQASGRLERTGLNADAAGQAGFREAGNWRNTPVRGWLQGRGWF